MKSKSIFCHLASAALLTIYIGSHAQAAFVVNIVQSGSDVVATGSGSINTSGLTEEGPNSSFGAVIDGDAGGYGVVGLGATSFTVEGFGGAIAGPTFGSINSAAASSGSGDPVLIAPAFSSLGVPVGYTSGDQLSDTATWDSTTIAGLGLTPGSYEFTWGSGATADSLTVDIGQAPAPEPGTICLLGIGCLRLLLPSLRNRSAHS